MSETIVYTETDKTKSLWVAKVYNDFVNELGRSRTTQRALFSYALKRNVSDYPICGGFVGEIRITRPYHESDGEKLPKWIRKAKDLGFIPMDAIFDEIPGENIFSPQKLKRRQDSVEVWLNKSSFNPLLHPVCETHGVTLVSVNGRASAEAIKALYKRCSPRTVILCLSDLSPSGAFFDADLYTNIGKLKPPESNAEILVKRIGLKPEQVLELKIPMVTGKIESKEDRDRFKRYLKPYSLDPSKIAELDALEVYYRGGIATFLDQILSTSVKSY